MTSKTMNSKCDQNDLNISVQNIKKRKISAATKSENNFIVLSDDDDDDDEPWCDLNDFEYNQVIHFLTYEYDMYESKYTTYRKTRKFSKKQLEYMTMILALQAFEQKEKKQAEAIERETPEELLMDELVKEFDLEYTDEDFEQFELKDLEAKAKKPKYTFFFAPSSDVV